MGNAEAIRARTVLSRKVPVRHGALTQFQAGKTAVTRRTPVNRG